MAETPSETQILLARLVIVLLIAFTAVGVFWYGLSEEVRHRVWEQLIARPTGPMAFRFILQPIMAAIAALRDGINDAKSRRSPYFWSLLANPFAGGHRLYEGLISTARVILLGLCMDAIYQWIVLKTFYPAEAVIVAIALAFFPYVLLRGPITRIARRRLDAASGEVGDERTIGMTNPSADTSRFEVKATASDHFSWLRTRLSVERTMMSWVRTATGLIGFGFAIVQFFDRVEQMPGVTPAHFPEAPRYLGLSLIFCGVAALVISIWEYHWGLRYLWGENFAAIAGVTREGKQTPLLAVAVVLALVGVFAFFAVLLRLL
jgi:putative membrane protein